ncbi:MAG TPA: hypothetical protein VLU91_00600 [Nitrososphaerales archaeon]|nr:hypothetical protein [Nitrososphaerales archaeon]
MSCVDCKILDNFAPFAETEGSGTLGIGAGFDRDLKPCPGVGIAITAAGSGGVFQVFAKSSSSLSFTIASEMPWRTNCGVYPDNNPTLMAFSMISWT